MCHGRQLGRRAVHTESDDDAPETVKKRLDVYHEQTAPLIDYYKKQGILKVIDGSKGLDTCFEEICGILEG